MNLVVVPKVPLLPPSTESDCSDSEVSCGGGHGLSQMLASDLTYGDVGLYAYGTAGKRLVDVAVIISQVGEKLTICCAISGANAPEK